jgi:outer membrane immunogenic protein
MISRAYFGGISLAAGTVVSVCSAQAADLPVRPVPAPVAPVVYAPPVYNWSGFYIGGNVGGGFADSSWTDPFTGANNTFSKDGFIGGGQIGANVQFNWLVLGVEGDFDWTGLKGSGTDSEGNTINTNTQWTATATGRIGAAFDRLLVYGKGGVAFANDESSINLVPSGLSASTTFTRTGWTAGAGLEYALAQNWTAKIEYDYLGFGSESLDFGTATLPTNPSASLNVQEVKAGINFKFGP